MTNDKVKGKVNEAVGAGKAEVGKAVENEELEAEGQGQELKGKGQGLAGDAKGKAKEFKEKIS
jgi:uncharacterized protein YjbJ (UPF0337 family)